MSEGRALHAGGELERLVLERRALHAGGELERLVLERRAFDAGGELERLVMKRRALLAGEGGVEIVEQPHRRLEGLAPLRLPCGIEQGSVLALL